MTDTNALRSIIADSGLKYKAIAEIMGLTPYALQMKGEHPTTGSVYTKFHKTKKLNEILKLWDDIKYRFDNMLDDGTVVKDYGQNCR